MKNFGENGSRMIIDCISDLHGHYPTLEGGDLLIVAGDHTTDNSVPDWNKFFTWLKKAPYKKKVIIGGNHDNFLMASLTTAESKILRLWEDEGFTYLRDSGTKFEGLKIWGSPWTKRFKGMNPKCMAFTVETEEELAEKWALIPEDTDILVTHGPPYLMLDEVKNYYSGKIENVGSKSLSDKMRGNTRLKLWIWGHIHENGGKKIETVSQCIFVNASHVNEHYEPVNKPIRIEL